MSLSERSRSTLYHGLSAVIDDEEAVGEMLSHFPTHDLDQPVTRDHLRAELAVLDQRVTCQKAEMAVSFAALDQRITRQGAEMVDRLATLQKEVSAEMRRWHLATLMVMVAIATLARLAG